MRIAGARTAQPASGACALVEAFDASSGRIKV
jgi:hypothetical protein